MKTSENPDFDNIKSKMQDIIDLIANKEWLIADQKLAKLSVLTDDFFDTIIDEKDLREIGRYQILILQLQQKIIKNGKS
jgi:hypothetical protein